MDKKHILIFEHDIIKYPPILSLINYLINEGLYIEVIGFCSDTNFIKKIESSGGVYYEVIRNDVKASKLSKILMYFNFKIKVLRLIKRYNCDKNVKVWLLGEKVTWLMHKVVFSFNTNVYLFEIPSFSISFRYRVLSLKANYEEILKNAKKVICCEYNRAHITKSFFELKTLPTIIPNKPISLEYITDEGLSVFDDFEIITKGKKIILYQGIFNYPERKLDDFCEAINYLPNEFILCLMGSDNEYKTKLKEKYESDRVLFIDYIGAPNHLEITKLAYIGILVYNAEVGYIQSTLNTLYCAPNKIFEYSKFGIPMIANDVPALSFLFEKYTCGLNVETFPKVIAETIIHISNNYNTFSKGSNTFYNSVDLEDLYKGII